MLLDATNVSTEPKPEPPAATDADWDELFGGEKPTEEKPAEPTKEDQAGEEATEPAPVAEEQPVAKPTATKSNKSDAPNLGPQEHWTQQVLASRRVVRERDAATERAQAEYKAMKESAISAHADLDELLDRGPEYMPLFDGPITASVPATEPSPASEGPAPASPDWRNLPIEDLGLSAKKVEKLVNAGIPTFGHFSDHVAKHGYPDSWAKDIRGIGPAAVIEIMERFMAFWEKHPEYCPPATATSADTASEPTLA